MRIRESRGSRIPVPDRAGFDLRGLARKREGESIVPLLRLADFLREDLVLWDLPGTDKSTLLGRVAAEVGARVPAVGEGELLERLLAREAEQSTGIGEGLALPHVELPGLDRSLLVVARPRVAVDFAALDARPVDLLILLISPPGGRIQHLRLLAHLARILGAEEALDRLRRSEGPGDLFRMLLEEDARHVG